MRGDATRDVPGPGGFSPRYGRPSIEDIDLGYRLRGAGGRVHVVPELQVTHLKRWTWRSLLKTDVVWRRPSAGKPDPLVPHPQDVVLIPDAETLRS